MPQTHAKDGWKSFELKIYLGLAFLVIAFLPALFFAFYSISNIASQRKQVVLRHSEELILAERLGKEFNSQLSLVPVFVLSGDEKLLLQLEENEARLLAVIARLDSMAITAEERVTLGYMRSLAERLDALVEEGVRMRKSGVATHRVHLYFSEKGGPISVELRSALTRFTDAKSADLNEAKDQLSKHTNNLITGLVLVSLLAAISVALISALLVRIMRAKERAEEEQDKIFLHEMHLSTARKEAVETVAHDLRSPLTAMRLRIELLKGKADKGALDPEQVRKELGRLLKVSDSMQKLIQDFLDHAKIEAGRLLLNRSHRSPGDLIRDVAENLSPLAHAKAQRIEALVEGEVPEIDCDPDRLSQALENLVANAVKFTPSGGTITLTAVKNNRYVVFTVSDTGPGIPKEKLASVFERYWQDGATAKAGSGLGLAIVSGIAKAHGGNVFAESVLGKGTSVHLYIPLSAGLRAESYPPTALANRRDSHMQSATYQ